MKFKITTLFNYEPSQRKGGSSTPPHTHTHIHTYTQPIPTHHTYPPSSDFLFETLNNVESFILPEISSFCDLSSSPCFKISGSATARYSP